MGLLFVHDHRFKKSGSVFYSNGGLDDRALKRYTDIFGEVTVASRVENVEQVKNYSQITNKQVTITNAYDDVSLMKELVKQSDFIIFRLPSKLGITAIKYAKKYNKPYLIELVGCPWDAYWNYSMIGKLVAPIMWYFTKKAVKSAKYVLYVSEKFLPGRYPTDGKAVFCSDVSLEEFNEEVLSKRIEKVKGPENKIVLGTVGAVNVKYKGQQYVIKAISKLKKEGYAISYRLAGGGDSAFLKEVAKKYGIEDCVEFYGAIPHDEIFEFLDDIDIYIQPSLLEGLPRAVVEAMSRACPVLGTNAGGIPELVNDKYMFRKKSIKDICQKIKTIINKDELIKEAQRSFLRASDFEKEKLETKRNQFFKRFKTESECRND